LGSVNEIDYVEEEYPHPLGNFHLNGKDIAIGTGDSGGAIEVTSTLHILPDETLGICAVLGISAEYYRIR